MIIVNFSHPLTEDQLHHLEALCGEKPERMIEVSCKLDPQHPFGSQAHQLADDVGLDAGEWQTERILIVPPALSFMAALLIAVLHGRMGYFPACIRLRPVDGALPPKFEVAEIMNLDHQRAEARARR